MDKARQKRFIGTAKEWTSVKTAKSNLPERIKKALAKKKK